MTYVPETGKVVYRSNPTHGKNRRNFEIFTAEEFVAAITQHIPDKSFQMIRYYGWYSNRARGQRKKLGRLRPGDEPQRVDPEEVKVLDVSTYNPPRVPSKTWQGLRDVGAESAEIVLNQIPSTHISTDVPKSPLGVSLWTSARGL